MITDKSEVVAILGAVKRLKSFLAEIDGALMSRPDAWGKHQSYFNQLANEVFRAIMICDQALMNEGRESEIYDLKKMFENEFRKIFLVGEYIPWSFNKPYGYAGDFQIIDHIYLNNPKTEGVARLFDNYFLASPASSATRHRKEDFKRFLVDFVRGRSDSDIKIMDLASGPCRDLRELSYENGRLFERVRFDCYENDPKAIQFAESMVNGKVPHKFIKENVVRLALKNNILDYVDERYDLIFSTGLFDYIDHKLAVRLISNLKKILKKDGLMIISNYMEKYTNTAFHFMEWVGDWNLVYRTEDEFRAVFKESGFNPKQLSFSYEQQGIMQYCFAKV